MDKESLIKKLEEYASWIDEHPDDTPKEFYQNILHKLINELKTTQ